MAGVRLHRMTSRTVLVLLVVHLLPFLFSFQEARAQDAGCSHKYTDHLLHNPTCNPYVLGIMKLQCIVEVPLNATEITIGWFLNCEQLNNGSHVAIEALVQPTSEVRRIRSRLTISDLTDDYAGVYTCNILGDEEYIPSKPFDLGDRDFLEVDLALEGGCTNGQVFLPNVNEKCAVITEENSIPMSLVCDAPPATSSQILPSSSTPLVSTTSPPLPSSSSPPLPSSSTTPPTHSDSTPSPTDPSVSTTTASTREDATSLWLYVVVAVAAVFFMIIVVLAIVCVGMCVWRNKGIDEQRPTQPEVTGKHITSGDPGLGYDGEYFPDGHLSSSPPPPLPPTHPSIPTPYNTLDSVEYEVIGPGTNYHRLERPTLKSGLISRFGSTHTAFSPSTTMTSVYPMSATPNGAPAGITPPPLPSMSHPRGATAQPMRLIPNSPESSTTLDGVFLSGSVDVSSPLERDRMDSTSFLIPRDKKGSCTTGEFEGLYTPRGHQRHSPSSPRVSHPLQKIPETGSSFPEPLNPHPFPSTSTYESIPGEDSSSETTVVAGYERPLPSPNKSGRTRAVTLPVRSPHVSPPPYNDLPKLATASLQNAVSGGEVRTVGAHGHNQELELNTLSGPVYHSLEQGSNPNSPPHHQLNGLPESIPQARQLRETAGFTGDSDSSGGNTLTPGFPVVSADFADTPTTRGTFPASKARVQRRQVTNELSSDFTGDSDYPQIDDALTDCTGGSSTSAYPESEWTGGTSGTVGTLTGDSTVFRFNGRSSTHSASSNTSSSNRHTPTLSSDGGVTNTRRKFSGDEGSNRPPSYDGTPTRSLSDGLTPDVSPVNGMTSPSEPMSNGVTPPNVAIPNGNLSMAGQVPVGSSHTAPVTGGGYGASARAPPSSQTISTPRNHYKRLDPSTMDPHLKYTRLNVGKLTVV